MKQFKNILFFLFLLICVSTIQSAYAQTKTIALYKGIIIKHSVIVKKQLYHFEGTDSLSIAPVIIEGDNITVDFNGAVIEGSTDIENPDKFEGTGVIIKSGSHITIKNLTVKGFKVGIIARGIKRLSITGSDFSYNYKQHLNSTRDREDLADWQSYHHNEHDEWLRYGAAIYLRDCDSADVRSTTITDGQCGLMMTNCSHGFIYNNNFSFNSGLGIGMYRSSYNLVWYNKLDWNVRGYSDGVYYRGQDSAGILVFEQCNNNSFAFNSVTHSGDGFFLWAGQTTMDTGEGGCNDNLLYANDFSYAPTNGIELTFSRNKIIGNKVNDCWHGIWGGFSYSTLIANNDFSGNMSTIAIEHGMNDTIVQNKFNGDKVAIELWSNPKMTKSYGYVQKRDTRSMNYTITDNTFINVKNVFNINNTSDINITNNQVKGSVVQQKLDSTVHNIYFDKIGDQVKPASNLSYFPKIIELPAGGSVMLPSNHPKGRKYLMIGEWGPYNFRYPIAWWQKTDSAGKIYLDMMGPAGKWKIVKMKGASNPSAQNGEFPAKLAIQKDTASLTDIDVEMEYTGAAVTSPFGVKSKAGAPYLFHYREFNAPTQWQMQWFAFDDTNEPLKHEDEFKKLIGGSPAKTTTGKLLADVFGKNFGKNIARQKISTVSTTEISVPAATYRLGISASELVKLYVDGKLVIENWDPAKLKNDEDNHKDAIIKLSGRHTIRVEQAQYGDYGMLNFRLEKM